MATLEIVKAPLRTADKPFYFTSSAHLLRIGRQRATTLAELFDALHTCPDDSIFQHTFRTLEEHHFIRQGFSNDFAHWAFTACDEVVLAEHLAGVDVRDFTSIAALRDHVIKIVADYIHWNPNSQGRVAREPFYFCSSEIVVLHALFTAATLPQFSEGLARATVHCIHHHFIEARLRLKLMSNDFSRWLQEELRLPEMARAVNRIDIYTATLEDVRRQILGIVAGAMESTQ
jgi:uncharacterized protein DUF5752